MIHLAISSSSTLLTMQVSGWSDDWHIALLLRRVCPLLGGVSFVKTMNTGGKGSRGNGGGPDALFSQDSVLVSHGNLFAVNVRRLTERVPCSTARALTLIMRFQTNNIVRLKYPLCV